MREKRKQPMFSWRETGALILTTFKSLLMPFLLILAGLILAILLFAIMF